MNSVRTRKTHAKGRIPKKMAEPLDEGPAGMRKGRYTKAEVELIKERYPELVEEGLNDTEIARRIGKELRRSVDSVDHKLRRMSEDGGIERNSNRRDTKKYTEHEIKVIKQRYLEFFGKGMGYTGLAKRIADELKRKNSSVKRKIQEMRKAGKIGEGANPQERKKFTEKEIELTKKGYSELVKKGLNDYQIARKISVELGRKIGSVHSRIKRMQEKGEIKENPNEEGKKFTDEEVELIKRMYVELVKQGLNDSEIARKIGKKLGRSVNSVDSKIKRLRKNGEIEENPNKAWKGFSDEEIKLTKRRYAELVEKGLSYREIARRIGKELGRSFESILKRMRELRKDREIGENSKKVNRRKYCGEEIESIRRRYNELKEQGLNDNEIARRIGNELGRSVNSIGDKIKKLRRDRRIGKNPNKEKRYSDAEIELIKRRCHELVKKGLNNKQIAKEIGEEIGRNTGSVKEKIRRMKMDGEFVDIEIIREREDILGVVQALEDFGEEE